MDWLTNFFWTPAELALAVPVGVILAGVISYFGARKGSKDLSKIQDKVIQSQKDLAQMQREHALFDKRSDSYVDMIRILQTQPYIPSVIEPVEPARTQVLEYREKIAEWITGCKDKAAPLHAYASGDILPILIEEQRKAEESVMWILSRLAVIFDFEAFKTIAGRTAMRAGDWETLREVSREVNEENKKLWERSSALITLMRDDLAKTAR